MSDQFDKVCFEILDVVISHMFQAYGLSDTQSECGHVGKCSSACLCDVATIDRFVILVLFESAESAFQSLEALNLSSCQAGHVYQTASDMLFDRVFDMSFKRLIALHRYVHSKST
jgi:hypothetical protein